MFVAAGISPYYAPDALPVGMFILVVQPTTYRFDTPSPMVCPLAP